MISFPNAKINLGLNIVERRDDGYHNIETVFYPVPLTDVLEIVPATGEASLMCYGNVVDCPAEKNLVMKAYRLMQQRYDLPPVAMHLYKHIPDGAGLGGGSSDAAHAMLMLNTMFGLHMPDAELAAMAATLGADCPFFILNTPCYAEGIGEKLQPIPLNLSGLYLAIVRPAIPVSTKEAFSLITPMHPERNCRDIVMSPVESWRDQLVNDFEKSVFTLYPEIGRIKQRLYDLGAVYAAMSRSGSSLFGIFRSPVVLDEFDSEGTFKTLLRL